jgi:hypothetical protein
VSISTSDEAARARSELARHATQTRWCKVTDPDQRRRQTQPARVAAAVKVLVDAWPTLDPAQVARLRSLLQQPGGGPDA